MPKVIKFIEDGNNTRVISYNDEMVKESLKPAIYTLKCCQYTGFYLAFHSEKFSVPARIYGSLNQRVEKVLTTYDSRDASTGVLLTGDKGAGKTMTSSLMANAMLDRGLPVILIEDPHRGAAFNEFINNIGECALFFDEFGKIFDQPCDEPDPQDKLLSIFDGTGSRKRLIILTENESHKINSFMLNRPGRIFYHFRHKKLDDAMVQEFCQAKGLPNDVIEEIQSRVDTSYEFSFDVLSAVVEEYLRFGGSIEVICADLNIEQPLESRQTMTVLEIVDTDTGNKIIPHARCRGEIRMPTGSCSSQVVYFRSEEDQEDDNYDSTRFNVKDIVKRDMDEIVYVSKDHSILIRCKINPIPAANGWGEYSKFID